VRRDLEIVNVTVPVLAYAVDVCYGRGVTHGRPLYYRGWPWPAV
jgi:hypothetical protein